MKKPLLAAVGVAGACAACCAVPLVVPLLSGLAASGLLAWGWMQDVWAMPLAIGLGVMAIGGVVALMRTRKRAVATVGPACGTECGCATAGRAG